MSHDYGPELEQIAAAQAVLAFEKMYDNWHTRPDYQRASLAAQEKLIKAWSPRGNVDPLPAL